MTRPDPFDYGSSRYESAAFGAGTVHTRWWHELYDGRVQCDICPRACKLNEGQRGLCFVRAREGDEIVLTTYGRSSGYCIDPIEKKPLNHFLPGSSVLSFGTAGCNLTCKFCQNWDISKSREVHTLTSSATPRTIAQAAIENGCRSVAFTYNDPIVFLEYALDTARECRDLGVKTVAVTAGYVERGPRAEFFDVIDAVNVDLKAFSEDYYRKVCGGDLNAVLDTITWLAQQSSTWFELTTLLVPGLNDSDDEISTMVRWVLDTVGPDVPLHFSAFHPDWKMTDVPHTPHATLNRARDLALELGMRYVYVGNVHDADGATTYCLNCRNGIIVRDWYDIDEYLVDENGRCLFCQTRVPGVFDGPVGTWGRKRQPLVLRDPVPSHEDSARLGPLS
jgi:pyruvate formate lyase activating enzyme